MYTGTCIRGLPLNLRFKCTFDCPALEGLFIRKSQWIQHETEHREAWVCRYPTCGRQYGLYGSYRAHILNAKHYYNGDCVDIWLHDTNGGRPVFIPAPRYTIRRLVRIDTEEAQEEGGENGGGVSRSENRGRGGDQYENQEMEVETGDLEPQLEGVEGQYEEEVKHEEQTEEGEAMEGLGAGVEQMEEVIQEVAGGLGEEGIQKEDEEGNEYLGDNDGDAPIIIEELSTPAPSATSSARKIHERQLELQIRKWKMEQEAAAIKAADIQLELDKLQGRL